MKTRSKKGKGFKFPGIAGGLLSLGGTVTALVTATSPEEDAAVEGSEERWKRIRARYTQEEIDAARKNTSHGGSLGKAIPPKTKNG
ncbi:hypothetical protein O5699_25645 [Escherichia coli]|nr:hypothetical protein [Escherichia coli]